MIVHLSSVHPSNDTRIYYKMCKSLVKAGYDVDLIIQHPKDEEKDGINIKALPQAYKKTDRIFKIIPQLIKKALSYPKKTIFQFHDPELIPVGLLLKVFGYKVIYDVHEDVPKDLLTKEWIPQSFRKILSGTIKFIERCSSPFFDGIITVVPTITERFKKYNKNVFEIRNFPILKENSISQKSEEAAKKYVIYVGSLTTRRGIPKLVEAIDLVKDKSVELWLGGGFAENGLQEQLEAKAGRRRTNYLGWVNQSEINALLRKAEAGLLTLEVIPSHNESYNVKLFEYMLAEIPVISTNLTFPKEIISTNDCGIVIEEHSAEEIARAIDWVIEHPRESSEMGKKGKKAVLSSYTWNNEEKVLYSLYEGLS